MEKLTNMEESRIRHSLKLLINGSESVLNLRDVVTIDFKESQNTILILFMVHKNHSEQISLDSFKNPNTDDVIGETCLILQEKLEDEYNYKDFVYTKEKDNLFQMEIQVDELSES